MATDLDLTDLGLDEEIPPAVESVPGEIVDPTSGEIINPTDVDALVDAWIRVKAADSKLYVVKRAIQAALLAASEGDEKSKTRRVRGRTHRVKLTLPAAGWVQSILKEAYHAYPQFRDEVLKIDTVGVKAIEFKKMANETGPADWSQFKSMVQSAVQASTAMPTIEVEE